MVPAAIVSGALTETVPSVSPPATADLPAARLPRAAPPTRRACGFFLVGLGRAGEAVLGQRPGRTPVAPFLVPLPMGALVSSLIFDILTWTRPRELPWLVDGAWWLIGVGLIGVAIAAVFGAVDLLTIPRGTRLRRSP